MDKQHALNVLNSKQLHNVVKLFEKYAQVPGATNICVKDLDFQGLQIAYAKEGQEEVFSLAFPHTLKNFEGIRDALIALLGEDAPSAAQGHQNAQQNPQESSNPQNGFGPQGQHPFGAYAHFGAQHPQWGPNHQSPQWGFGPQVQGFQGFGPHGMFMFGFMPFCGFGPMGFLQWGFNPQGQNPQQGFHPQAFGPQSQSPQDGTQPAQPQPAQTKQD
ncbi:DUF2470 domain-containing protein [Helicobacter ailurogastricus]|uniref:DUF2470 domain-containing protein n=1 Tax=Helicobacter ailurogastricus TaxID=1578720 RepID=A0A0K2X8W1_9HELI|nr:DUF2470 domain-containing protein [Helicobacter ailurogastricus]CRF41159.1 hypothetical protein HAL011_09450 [Helicobacter ailurogastricus]CRF43383.1 hypothetical protein HAL013_16190 [Helicobacter ailurogastricus]CRF44444.1 hypothetical protein HAL09_10270 [Helicobacter ailurogastricus]